MLLFASGRSDVPAFYSEWFMNRLRAGFVDVRNPYYGNQVTRYKINKDVVDCIVFCTKNPEPMLKYMEEIKSLGLAMYFFVTITPYGKDVEPNVPEKESVMEAYIRLAELVGVKNVCWRYDPIFVDEKYSVSAHIKAFRHMCETLRGKADRCIISFIDLYQKTKKNFPDVKEVSEADQKFLAQAFSRIAFENSIKIESCAEKLDLSAWGVEPGACVSRKIIEGAAGYRLIKKAGVQNLRKHCECLPTRDIGFYNSCPRLCRYCYANYDERIVRKNYSLHNPLSSLMIGNLEEEDEIKEASQKSLRDAQLYLF